MIWLLANDLNYEGAKHLQQLRSPLLELTAYFQEDYNSWLTYLPTSNVTIEVST